MSDRPDKCPRCGSCVIAAFWRDLITLSYYRCDECFFKFKGEINDDNALYCAESGFWFVNKSRGEI